MSSRNFLDPRGYIAQKQSLSSNMGQDNIEQSRGYARKSNLREDGKPEYSQRRVIR
jgi:hypothetical protein